MDALSPCLAPGVPWNLFLTAAGLPLLWLWEGLSTMDTVEALGWAMPVLLLGTTAGLSPVRRWILNHDDSLLFTIFYIGLSVVLSIWLGLFWLIVMVSIHFLLEWIRQAHLQKGWGATLRQALWETKLDLALVLFALALALYMDVIFGILGLRALSRVGAIARAGVRGTSRFAAWQRTIRGALLALDDAAQVVRAFLTGRKRVAAGAAEPSEPAAEPATPAVETPGPAAEPPVQAAGPAETASCRWSAGDWFAIGLGVACVALIVLSPLLTDHTVSSALSTLAEDLHPLPMLAR